MLVLENQVMLGPRAEWLLFLGEYSGMFVLTAESCLALERSGFFFFQSGSGFSFLESTVACLLLEELNHVQSWSCVHVLTFRS